MNGSYADLAHYGKHLSQFSSTSQRMVCTRGCRRLHSFILSLFSGGYWNLKKKKNCNFGFKPQQRGISCFRSRAWMLLIVWKGRGGKGDLKHQIGRRRGICFFQKSRKEGASDFVRGKKQLFSGPRGGGVKERAVGQNNCARRLID